MVTSCLWLRPCRVLQRKCLWSVLANSGCSPSKKDKKNKFKPFGNLTADVNEGVSMQRMQIKQQEVTCIDVKPFVPDQHMPNSNFLVQSVWSASKVNMKETNPLPDRSAEHSVTGLLSPHIHSCSLRVWLFERFITGQKCDMFVSPTITEILKPNKSKHLRRHINSIMRFVMRELSRNKSTSNKGTFIL